MANSGRTCHWCLESKSKISSGDHFCLECKNTLCETCARSHMLKQKHDLQPVDNLVFCDVCDLSNADAYCWACKKHLCDICTTKHRSTQLTKGHQIEIHERQDNQGGQTNAYVIDDGAISKPAGDIKADILSDTTSIVYFRGADARKAVEFIHASNEGTGHAPSRNESTRADVACSGRDTPRGKAFLTSDEYTTVNNDQEEGECKLTDLPLRDPSHDEIYAGSDDYAPVNKDSEEEMYDSVNLPKSDSSHDYASVNKVHKEEDYDEVNLPPKTARYESTIAIPNAVCVTFMYVLPDNTVLLYDNGCGEFMLYDAKLANRIWSHKVDAKVSAVCTHTDSTEVHVYTASTSRSSSEIAHYAMDTASSELLKTESTPIDYHCSGLTSCFLGIAVLQNMTKGKILLHIHDFECTSVLTTLSFDLGISQTKSLQSRKDPDLQRFSLATLDSGQQVVIADCKYSFVSVLDIAQGTMLLRHEGSSLKGPTKLITYQNDAIFVLCKRSRNVHALVMDKTTDQWKSLTDQVLFDFEGMADGICYHSSRGVFYISHSNGVHLFMANY